MRVFLYSSRFWRFAGSPGMLSVLRLLMEVVLICRQVLGEVWCGRREWIGWLARSEAEVDQAFPLASASMVRWYCGDSQTHKWMSQVEHDAVQNVQVFI